MSFCIRPWLRSTLGISMLCAAWAIASGSAHALPTTRDPYFGQATAAGDFDRDGNQEFVIGDPSESVDGQTFAGVVYVYNSLPSGTYSRTEYSLSSTGIPGSPGLNNRFGTALAVGDFDDDGYDDLAIGMPGKYVADDQGAVIVIHGSQTGLSRTRIAQLTPPGDTTPNADYWGFGFSLAAGQFNDDYTSDLAIGFPGRVVNDQWYAGAVYVHYGKTYEVMGSGHSHRWTQDTNGIANQADGGETFGYSLAAGDFDRDYIDDLAIGAPCEEINGLSCAGAIHVLYGATNQLLPGDSQFIHQGLPEVHGAAEENDQFGLALTAGRFDSGNYRDLAVGVPHESIGDIEQAGFVNLLYGSPDGLGVTKQSSLAQGGGAGDYSRARDRYGSALANGDFDGNGYDDLVVGAPNDYVAGTYGSFLVYYSGSGGVSSSNYQFWHSNSPGLTAPRPRIGGDAFSVGDFDDDGALDVASTTTKFGGEVEILEGRDGAKLTTDGGFSFP